MHTDGLQHIHNLMHSFIGSIASGVYTSLDDVQQDAQEYLAMEKVVQKLSNWDENSSVEELSQIFSGLSNSINQRKVQMIEEKNWQQLMEMPKLGEENNVK